MKQLALRNNTPPRAAFRSSAAVGCIRPQAAESARVQSDRESLPVTFLPVGLCLRIYLSVRRRSYPFATYPVPCYSVQRLSKCLW